MRDEYRQRYSVTVERLRIIAGRLHKHLRPVDVSAALFAVAIEQLLTSRTSEHAARWLRDLADDVESVDGDSKSSTGGTDDAFADA